jgi:hypothetical protein
MVPATEWLCSHLAAACGLPVPHFSVVEVSGYPGVPFFGSQWQGGALDYWRVAGHISNPAVFAETHAVDLFVHNIDRHTGNYLYLQLAGEIVARVIDFSHSLLVMGWPLPPLPMAPCNTTTELPRLLAEDPTKVGQPKAILAKIAALPNDWMKLAVDAMPPIWLSNPLRADLTQWWDSGQRAARLVASEAALPP